MKIWKLISVLLLACLAGACDDDFAGKENDADAAGQAKASFGYESKTVLKNGGQVLVPVCLDVPASNAVKVTVKAEEGGTNTIIAREGIDFNVPDRVVTIPAGDTVAYLAVDLLDNGKVDNDREIKLNIAGVYGAEAGEQKSVSLYVVSNSFVEFEKSQWLTYESAASNETYQSTCLVPLKILGNFREPVTLVIDVVDSTAIEYQHFELKSKKISVSPGDEMAYIELIPIDDSDINYNRIFSLTLASVEGGNMVIAKEKNTCEVTIFSEEVMKTASILETEVEGEEGGTAEITVLLDHAPTESEAPLIVKLEPIDGEGNALLGEDYEFAGQIVFNADETEKKLTLSLNEDDELFDKSFSLRISSISGGNSYDATPVKMTIKNNDFPYFTSTNYGSYEGSGENGFLVKIPKALEHDVTLQIENVDVTAVSGVNYKFKSATVTIEAGQTEGTISYDVLVERQFKPASFQVKVTGWDGMAYDGDISTTVSIIENKDYRKWLGKCNFLYNTTEVATEVIAGNTDEEFANNFGHYYFVSNMKGFSTWIAKLEYNNGNVSIVGANTGYRFGSYTFESLGLLEGAIMWRTSAIENPNSYYNVSCPLNQNGKVLTIADDVTVCFYWYKATSPLTMSDISTVFKITMTE